MPEKETVERAHQDAQEGKSPSTQAGEFVREEIHHIREGKHGAQSAKQAVAIGLSKARRAGVRLRKPKRGTASAKTRAKASRDLRAGRSHRKTSAKRSRATKKALRRESRKAASKRSLQVQARRAARKRGAVARHATAMKAVRTKRAHSHSTMRRKAG